MTTLTLERAVRQTGIRRRAASWLPRIARLVSAEHYYRDDVVALLTDVPIGERELAALRWHARQRKVV